MKINNNYQKSDTIVTLNSEDIGEVKDSENIGEVKEFICRGNKITEDGYSKQRCTHLSKTRGTSAALKHLEIHQIWNKNQTKDLQKQNCRTSTLWDKSMEDR